MTTTEQRILSEAEHALKRTTGLVVEIHPAPVGRDRGIDAVLELIQDRAVDAGRSFDSDHHGNRQHSPMTRPDPVNPFTTTILEHRP